MARTIPSACSSCIVCVQEGSECHRHKPGRFAEPMQFVRWPKTFKPCAEGGDVRAPGDLALVSCKDCRDWSPLTESDIPRHRSGLSLEFWRACGWCLGSAGFPDAVAPGDKDRREAHPGVTHAMWSCGSGVSVREVLKKAGLLAGVSE